MKEETIERTSTIGSNKEVAITGVKRERNLRLKEWNPAEDDPQTIRPTLRSTLTTPSIHTPTYNSFDPHKPTKREQRIENRGREERIEGDHQNTSNQ